MTKGAYERMGDLKQIIARNIIDLRKSMQLTQAELAEKLNYSDKAISKWERAESVPDVAILKQIADLFGVKVDYLLVEEHTGNEIRTFEESRQDRKNKTIVAWLGTGLIWLIATMVFVYMGIYTNGIRNLWIIYVYAFPMTVVVLLIFNSVWGIRRRNFFIISVLVWSLLLTVYLALFSYNLWLIFILGIPTQFIIILWSGFKWKKPGKK
jgi:transcriptional regulator with XRE-family HTH domain